MKEKNCPECGCPVGNESVCPDCGCPIESASPSPRQSVDSPSTSDYNENEEPYTPFSKDSWYFRVPTFLVRYPERGDFAKAHPFLGWLFNPWHISYRGNGNKDAFDALNNVFLLCNLIAKTFVYPMVWELCKLLVVYILFIILLLIGNGILDAFPDSFTFLLILLDIILIPLAIVSAITYLCGMAVSLRRYLSPMYDTFMRLCKRFSISVTKSVKENNLNA